MKFKSIGSRFGCCMAVLSGMGLCLFLLPGCAVETGEPLDENDLATRNQPLWVVPGATPWPGGGISVCFDSSVGSSLRSRVRRLVEDSWEKAANIEFSAWGNCGSNLGSWLKVTIDPSISPNVGSASAGKKGDNQNIVKFVSSSPTDRTIVHEFGHVLGFQNENIDDTCIQQNQGTSLEGQGDMSRSVMTQSSCSSKATLSAWDILGARSLYGKKPRFSVVGLGGLCMNLEGADGSNGAGIMGWPCSGQWNDRWFRGADAHLQTGSWLNSSGSTRCLDVPHGTVTNGFSELNAWDCTSSAPEQAFTFEGVDWLAMGNRCVEAEAAISNARLSIQNCDQAVSRQKWDFFNAANNIYNTIRLNGTNLCVELPNGNTALGTELRLRTCSGSANQTFQHYDGHIAFSDSRCLGVSGGTITNGNRIVLWNGCYLSPPTINEQFTIRGPVKALGQCVSLESSSPYDGIPVGMTPCSGALLPQQVWEYFW